MKIRIHWFVVFFILFYHGCGYSVSCLNNNGEVVDWWVIIKKPGLIGKINDAVYIDSTQNIGREINLKEQNNQYLRQK